MKAENKEINIGRSEEFTLAGQENTVPSPLQHSPKMPVLLSPCGLLPFSFTCLSLQYQKLHPLKVILLLVAEFTQRMR